MKELRSAPTAAFGTHPGSLPFYRFPQWLFCPRCRRMTRWSTKMEQPNQPATCPACGKGGRKPPQLVPMRFVLVCEDGHLSDIPWPRWAHSLAGDNHKQRQCQTKDPEFVSLRGVGGGLNSLEVHCRSCDARRSLAGITTAKSFEALGVSCSAGSPGRPVTRRRPAPSRPCLSSAAPATSTSRASRAPSRSRRNPTTRTTRSWNCASRTAPTIRHYCPTPTGQSPATS